MCYFNRKRKHSRTFEYNIMLKRTQGSLYKNVLKWINSSWGAMRRSRKNKVEFPWDQLNALILTPSYWQHIRLSHPHPTLLLSNRESWEHLPMPIFTFQPNHTLVFQEHFRKKRKQINSQNKKTSWWLFMVTLSSERNFSRNLFLNAYMHKLVGFQPIGETSFAVGSG